MKKLFVSSLPYSVRDDELAEIFADFGPVESAVVIMVQKVLVLLN